MSGNSINLFKKGYAGWGGYVAWIQGTHGELLTGKLTGYNYRNRYLNEIYYGW